MPYNYLGVIGINNPRIAILYAKLKLSKFSTSARYLKPSTSVEDVKVLNVASVKDVNDNPYIRVDVHPFTSLDLIYWTVNSIFNKLEHVNNKGYILETDLVFDNTVLFDIEKLFRTTDYKSVLPKGSFATHYKWSFNFLILSLYYYMTLNLVKVDVDLKKSEDDSDLLQDYKHLMSKLYNKLDPSIRVKLQKPGVSVIQNTYTGFDTEYKFISGITNKLISVQLAVNTRTIIKIPKCSDYYTSKMDSLSSKRHAVNKIPSFNYDLLESSVNVCIRKLRNLKFREYDEYLYKVREEFKTSSTLYGWSMFEKEDFLVINLPRTPTRSYIYLNESGKGFNFSDIINISNDFGGSYLDENYKLVTKLLSDVKEYNKFQEVEESLLELQADIVTAEIPVIPSESYPRYRRSSIKPFNLSVNRVLTHYVIGHLTNADLSLLKDFDKFKESLDIVNKSFVTLGKPLRIGSSNVIIRDTMLLAPGGKKSLAHLGTLVGLHKIPLSLSEYEAMDVLLRNDRKKFLEYAKNDAVITLHYANKMEDQLFDSRGLGIPISLSSLSAAFVRDEWEKVGYKGYQVNPLFLLGDSGVTQTPKGLYVTKDIGLKLSMYIANYRGGRNESFMYGVDNDKVWKDYDLASAYTSAMSLLGNPNYNKSRHLTVKEFKSLEDKDLIFNYLILKAKFKFPDSVKYPSIPTYLDETTTIYPLEGECVLTGIEYLTARNQGCEFQNIKDLFIIPFETSKDGETSGNPQAKDYAPGQAPGQGQGQGQGLGPPPASKIDRPFFEIIKTLQARRRLHPKGSFENLMEKEKGNSIYGNIVKGMSNKRKFDIKTGRTVRMEGSSMSNPIIASWITAFIRSVIGESLHNVNLLGGLAVSVTTDGFITDLDNLEDQIKSKIPVENKVLLSEYSKIRSILSGEAVALELKSSGKGITSWTTRGQFSLDAQISAITGLQTKGIDKKSLDALLKKTLAGDDRIIEFIQSSLRSAKDIYVKGGHVTSIYSDRVYRMDFDNKRILDVPINCQNTQDMSHQIFDSLPSKTVSDSEGLRFLASVHKKRDYHRTSSQTGGSKYKSFKDTAVRNFIKGCLATPPSYNLTAFDSYSDLIDFIKSYDSKYKISKSSLSHLKNRKAVVKGIPKNAQTLAFVEYVKLKFPNFDDSRFYQI